MANIEIKLYVGEEAFSLLTDDRFQYNWAILQKSCPWATVFQSPAFVGNWYTVYQKNYLPIIVTETQNGRLTGLLTLAKKGKIIRSAGADLAEYCVWLAEDHNQESFIQEALRVVTQQFSAFPIYFKFIPEGLPLDWIQSSKWKNYCTLKPFKQPLLKVDAEWAHAKLNKRSRKQDLRRLQKLGKLSFERIDTYEKFEAILDELIALYDFRKGAVYNNMQFQQDPLRKKFFLNMFSEQLLYVTVLKLNDTIIAGDINYINNRQICLKGLNCHSPAHAKYSPGIFSLYFLNGHLAKEGYEEIDITPGGELYKSLLVTHYGLVHVLTVRNRYSKLSSDLRSSVSQFFKTYISKIASKANIEYDQLKKFRWKTLLFIDEFKNIEGQNIFTLLKTIVSKRKMVKQARRYISHLDAALLESYSFISLHKNNLRDLLAFEARGTLKSRWLFLRNAMKRLEAGDTVYSWNKEGCLMGCVWVRHQQVNDADGIQLEDFYFHPHSKPQILSFLKAVVAEISKEQVPQPLYAVDISNDDLLHEVLTKAGFKMAI